MLLSVHLGNFIPVDLDTCSSRNKTKMVEHKLVSFATIVRLCRLFQLYYYLCSGKTYQTKIMPFLPLCCDSEAVLSKNSPKLECSYWKIFIPNTEISIAKSEISVTGAARLLIWRNRMSFFFRRKERRGEISEIEPAQMTGLIWRGPLLRTPVRVWVAKAVKMQSRLAWNNLFANFSTLS